MFLRPQALRGSGEVLRLAALGHSDRAIANILQISVKALRPQATDKLVSQQRGYAAGSRNMRLNSVETKLGARSKTASEKRRNRIL
jgi:DNA-binding CsgD family transcriptional regulator